jgi:hypothetical protein
LLLGPFFADALSTPSSFGFATPPCVYVFCSRVNTLSVAAPFVAAEVAEGGRGIDVDVDVDVGGVVAF